MTGWRRSLKLLHFTDFHVHVHWFIDLFVYCCLTALKLLVCLHWGIFFFWGIMIETCSTCSYLRLQKYHLSLVPTVVCSLEIFLWILTYLFLFFYPCHHRINLIQPLKLLLNLLRLLLVQRPVPVWVLDGLWLLLNLFSQKYTWVYCVIVWGCLWFRSLWFDWNFLLWFRYFFRLMCRNFALLCREIFIPFLLWSLGLWLWLFFLIQVKKVCYRIFNRKFRRYPPSISCPVFISLRAHSFYYECL